MSALERPRAVTLLEPDDFKGPAALLIGEATPDAVETVAGMLLRYGKQRSGEARRVRMRSRDVDEALAVSHALDDAALDALRIPSENVPGSYRPERRRERPREAALPREAGA